jgi:hypothetical protein
MKTDRDDMVVALHQSQASEPQIAAISQAFDQTTSNVESMAKSVYAFGFMLAGMISWFSIRRSEPPRQNKQQEPHGELRHDHVA